MKVIGKNIKKLRLSRGMTQQQLADEVGAKTYTTITKWESGANLPQGKDLIVLSKLFNVSVDSILGIDDKKDIVNTSEYNYYPTSISAGIPMVAESVTEYDTEKISIPDNIMGKWAGHKGIFMMRVNGESMNKVIPDQSLIAVNPIELSQLKNGDIVVYNYDGEYAVKRFYRQDGKVIFRPDSNDLSFTDVVVDVNNGLDLKIKGKVVLYIVELD